MQILVKAVSLYFMLLSVTLSSFAKTDDLLSEHLGVSARRIEGADLPEFDAGLKPGLAGAFYYPDDASVRPDLLNRQWTDLLRSNGLHRRGRVHGARGRRPAPVPPEAVIPATEPSSSPPSSPPCR